MKGTYVREEPLTVYKSGNSKVVTIPAEFPIEVGDQLEISEIENGFILERQLKSKSAIDSKLSKLYKITGTENTPKIKNMTIKDLEKDLESIYD